MAFQFPGFANSRRFGDFQERQASKFLQRQGLQLLCRNYQCRQGEIDLVMQDTSGFLVFIEIRFRRQRHYGDPVATIDVRKQRKIRHAAASFLQANPRLAHLPCRFDVVGISPAADRQGNRFEWIRSAFV